MLSLLGCKFSLFYLLLSETSCQSYLSFKYILVIHQKQNLIVEVEKQNHKENIYPKINLAKRWWANCNKLTERISNLESVPWSPLSVHGRAVLSRFLPSKLIPNFEHLFCISQTSSNDKTSAKENRKRCHFSDLHCSLCIWLDREIYDQKLACYDIMDVGSCSIYSWIVASSSG